MYPAFAKHSKPGRVPRALVTTLAGVWLLGSWLATQDAAAAVPTRIAVQGVLRDGAGQLQSVMVDITVTIFDQPQLGNVIAGPYVFPGTPAINGLFTVNVEDPALPMKLAAVPAAHAEIAMGMEVFTRIPLASSPYALVAGMADALSPACVGCVSDVMVGALSGAKITGPVAVADNATKVQGVPVAMTAPSEGDVLKFSGGAWTPAAQANNNVQDAVLNLDGQVSMYNVDRRRYLVRASFDERNPALNTTSSFVPLDNARLLSLCADEDGCSVTLRLRNWTLAAGARTAVSVGPFHFDVGEELAGQQRAWRIAQAGTEAGMGTGIDNDNVITSVFRTLNCYFTDGVYIPGKLTMGDDVGFGLLNYNANAGVKGHCELVIDD